MASLTELIKGQMEKNDIKREKDVKELYLSNSNLEDVDDLSRFKNLRQLWLNGNKLWNISCLSENFGLAELYLQNNRLVDISGALQHLASLQILFLNNNQLQKLDKVVNEFKKMQNLKVLSLFNNPICQEPEYRTYVIHHVPSTQLLDRKEVLDSERSRGRKLYKQDSESLKGTIAFGRRSEGPPALYYPASKSANVTQPVPLEVGNSFYRDNPPYDSKEQAIKMRAVQRSLMEYSSFDWSKVPKLEERRTANEVFRSPQVITTRFR